MNRFIYGTTDNYSMMNIVENNVLYTIFRRQTTIQTIITYIILPILKKTPTLNFFNNFNKLTQVSVLKK